MSRPAPSERHVPLLNHDAEGTTMSPTIVDPQFQIYTGHLSNLDRCNRCGAQRSAHGPDWTCPPRLSSSSGLVLLLVGGLLAVVGAVLWAVAGPALNTLAAMALPGGLTLLICGAFIAGGESS
jgi:uncharacterized protein (DUF983 family)